MPNTGLYYHVAVLESLLQWWNVSNKSSWEIHQMGLSRPLAERELSLDFSPL